MAKFCRYCGNQLLEGASFCNKCGKPVSGTEASGNGNTVKMQAKVCPACGAGINSGQAFCRKCGASLNSIPVRRKTPTGVSGAVNTPGGRIASSSSTVPGGRTASGRSNISGGSAVSGSSTFYIVDYVKSLMRVGNIPTIIYLILNIMLVTFITCAFFADNMALGVTAGLLAYLVSVCVALSPFGEWILRYQMGCKPIQDQQVLNRITPVFNRVYARARQRNPALPTDVKLYMNDDLCPNAFATGRKTVCVTRGLLLMSDEQIEGILGHEFGHLSHHDTDTLLVITVGNMFINITFIVIRFFANITLLIASFFVDDFIGVITHAIAAFVTNAFLGTMMFLWTKIGEWLVMKTSRANEFEADYFSAELGYRDELCSALHALDDGNTRPQGVFAMLSSSHPPMPDRIARLQTY